LAAVKMNEINPKYENTRKIHRLLTNQNPGFLYKAGQWFSPGSPASSTNKTDRIFIAEILLKVASNTINPNSI
jgi:hypothetical protein